MSRTSSAKKSASKVIDVKVKMYRHGLGDCFLLTFTRHGAPFTMLIDCGVLVGTEDGKGNMIKVVRDIAEATKQKAHQQPRLDVVVVTHEHADHVSGFLQAKSEFKKFSIGEVWLAWTEDPDNELANSLRAQRSARIAALKETSTRLQGLDDQASAALRDGIDAILGFFELEATGAATTGTTRQALDSIKERAPSVYCRPTDPPRNIPELDGVRFYVLGPPEDAKLLHRSNPSKRGKEVYEMALDITLEESFIAALNIEKEIDDPFAIDEICTPFDRAAGIPPEAAEHHPFFSRHYYGTAANNAVDWRRIDTDWLQTGADLALALDSDTNNTSLVLAIELVESGKVLLFAADAQVGNWLSWHDRSWSITDAGGNAVTVTAADLLARTVLYKVGHHGSHNATLREKGLEMMTHRDLVAMIPVDLDMAGRKRWKMPFPPLKGRLDEMTKGRVLIADKETQPPDSSSNPPLISKSEWTAFCGRVSSHQLAIEYTVVNS